MNLQEIFTTEQGKKIIKLYDLTMVLLFGSQAVGRTHAHSDIDIAYLSKNSLDITEELQLTMELAQLFKNSNIDLVSLRTVKPLLRHEIMRNNIVLYQIDTSLYTELLLQAIREYNEYRPLMQIRKEYLQYRLLGYKKELNYA